MVSIIMAAPRVLVLRAPGTNCDEETAYAFRLAGAIAERVHVNELVANAALASRYQILCLPGGFSYGDDIGAGRILASRMRRHLAGLLRDFTDRQADRLMLGICNGMQVMMRLGVLTDGLPLGHAATLAWNAHGRFEDRWVHLAIDPQSPCVFLRNLTNVYLPIAHAEGRFLASNATVLQQMQAAGRLALRYSQPAGIVHNQALEFPLNPNGSQANVAGVCDASGRIFGLMPHPERHLDPTHHPFWTRRRELPEHGEGLVIFQNAVNYFR